MKDLDIAEYLKNADPILGSIIDQVSLPPWQKPESYFVDLIESIVSQQLSIKAADTIFKRFVSLFPNGRVTPEDVLRIDDERIRLVGLSYQKISYVKDLAKQVLESGITFEQFDIMSDEEIITELIKVKGIGRWTGEMFLMFAMGRPDVFSYGDLGIRNAIQKLYKLDHNPSKEEAEEISMKWKPYRTYACRYLWKSL